MISHHFHLASHLLLYNFFIQLLLALGNNSTDHQQSRFYQQAGQGPAAAHPGQQLQEPVHGHLHGFPAAVL
jgi:hypothetical protein